VLPVAILAGGLATRLYPLSALVPKALMSVAGRPFIFHQLDLLKAQGIGRVVLCVGHLGEQVRATVGDGRALGMSITYAFDGTPLLGTGGAIKQALPLLGQHFFVLYGDAYLPCPFGAVHAAYEAARQPALMTVMRNENRWDRSNAIFDGEAVLEYDKQSTRTDLTHIDFGVSVLSSAVFEPYADQGRLAGVEVSQRFYEIGSLHGMRETDAYLSHRA
jgi:NDP-sugar pyrophosphorylase family protein